MNSSAPGVCLCSYLGTLLVGGTCLLIGLFVVSFRHIFQLDVALTQEEIADQQLRDRTRAILETASQGSNEWLIWVLVGVVLLVLSILNCPRFSGRSVRVSQTASSLCSKALGGFAFVGAGRHSFNHGC